MAQPGYRRGRHRTLQLQTVQTPLRTMISVLRDRHLSLQVLLCVMAVAAMVIAIQAWSLPFPYHLGQRVSTGILSRVDFTRVDKVQTERNREMSLAYVPYVFKHDPSNLKKLPGELRAALKLLVSAPSLSEVAPGLITSFGLSEQSGSEGNKSAGAGTIEERFQKLKAIASDDQRLNDLEREVTSFIQPLIQNGVLVERTAGLQDVKLEAPVLIRSPDARDRTAMFSEIIFRSLLGPGGDLDPSWPTYPTMNSIRPMLESWLLVHTPPTLTYDEVATQEARQRARNDRREVTSKYNRGDPLVGPNQPITADHLALLRDEHAAVEQNRPTEQRSIRMTTATLMLVLLFVFNGYYLIRNQSSLVRSPSRLSIYLTALVVAVAVGRLLAPDPWRAEIIPVLATVMIFAIAYNQIIALLTAFSLVLITVMSTGGGLQDFVVMMTASAAAVAPLHRISSRSKLIKVGLWSGLACFFMSYATEIMAAESVRETFKDWGLFSESIRSAGWCVATGFLVAGSLPFIESTFGVVTNISLLEMGDVSHPLLQELVRRAPGTYNHSITMATIAETAAEAIGANGLLVRVGAYFHDIGKMLKPHYFIENITEGTTSRHKDLAPAMSTLIIIGHVKDGIDLAHQYGLPDPLIDFIEQHHGTTLVEYFYHAASKQADQNPDHKGEVMESSFRYPGPKPQSKEAGVMMLADAVESASRTLSEPTPKRIERLVHDLMMKRLLDGQFEESSLTMTELHEVEQSLVKSLIGIYHGRIKYPEQRSA